MFRVLARKTQTEATAQWDALAQTRFQQITSGKDITFSKLLAPKIKKLVNAEKPKLILDAGCGVGVLTKQLARKGREIIGVDPSHASIKIAQRHYGLYAKFAVGTLESFAKESPIQADVVVANMVLMDVIKLNSFLEAVRAILKKRGAFIFSITHPWFWSQYYGYDKEMWFRYDKTLVVEAPFRIAHESSHFLSTHIHRPLEKYLLEMEKAGFQLETLLEPLPPPAVQELYPEAWKYPRYLIGICR